MSCSGGGGPVSRSVWSLGAAEGSGASVGSSDGQELGGGTGLADGAGRGAGPAPACVKKPWGVGSKVAAPVFGGPSTSPPLGAESQYFLGGGGRNPRKTPHALVQFSEQQLMSSKRRPAAATMFQHRSVGCKGEREDAFFFFEVLPASTFSNWTTVPASAGEDQLAAFVRHNGPVQIGIDADVFKNLDDDHHITPDRCGNFTAIDHSLGIVGYNATADKGAYWIVKNSWGDAWADHGFLYAARGAPAAGHPSGGRAHGGTVLYYDA
ncbi:transferase [Aureococcus anophagefferens]|nr:transferase [Aureococcus anophagefferens]